MTTINDIIKVLDCYPDFEVYVKTVFNDGRTDISIPDGIASWRGDYSQPSLTSSSLGYANRRISSEFSEYLKVKIDDGLMTGYKGGIYLVNGDDPLWADNYGDYGMFAILGIEISIAHKKIKLFRALIEDARRY